MTQCTLEHPYQSGRHDGGEPLRPGGLELTTRAIQCAAFSAMEHILDLGCGTGTGTKLLRRHGCSAISLDRSSAQLAHAVRAQPNLTAVVADARWLPLADASVDGVLAECSLSLTGYNQATLGESYRVLRPSGRLAVTDVFARHEDPERAPLPGCLAGLVSRGEILAAMAAAGFIVQRWEDHSDVLKSFLAQLIFSGRGSETLWTGNGSAFTAALRACRPGYFLMIASKPVRSV
jgi:ubiquinone/menaquinone biosynthesis C-methylase UbiE